MQIRRIELTRVLVPYHPPVHPYQSRRGITQGAASTIVRIDTDEGLVGWGEGGGAFAADPGALLAGMPVHEVQRCTGRMIGAGIDPYARSGVEMALWDLIGKAAGVPLYALLGGKVRDRIDLCACIGIREPTASAEAARECVERWGFRTVKTKAGRDPREDLAVATAIVEELRGDAVLRPDANEGYSPETAEPLLREMEALGGGIQYFEDPCPGSCVEALARFRREISVPVTVNMAIFGPESAVPILRAGAAFALMPDTATAGGIWPVKQVAAVAEAFGTPLAMHCSHDLGLKTAAVAHLAASTPGFSLANDTTYHCLVADVLQEPFEVAGGSISVPERPGLGVEVDPAQLDRYRLA
jgi:L-alanine-DL-glutamate epimerase-like enolase superfamily enzyme